jgi:hypothetical protein
VRIPPPHPTIIFDLHSFFTYFSVILLEALLGTHFPFHAVADLAILLTTCCLFANDIPAKKKKNPLQKSLYV